MAGYNGYSMSNNAVSAYENGEKPLSRWTKEAIISALENDSAAGRLPQEALETAKRMTAAELKNLVLRRSSWHHTSAKYNRTDFYSISTDSLCDHLGFRQAMFCNTPDGEKSGMWSGERGEDFKYKCFTADDGTVYNRETVTLSRFGFIKK